MAHRTQPRERRPQLPVEFSLKQKPRIKLDFMSPQEGHILLLESLPFVMLLLIPQIRPHRFDLRVADRERGVSLLPFKPSARLREFVDPLRHTGFDVTDGIGDSDCGRQSHQ